MKKLVALLLATVMVFLLIGCGTSPKEDDVTLGDPAQPANPSEEDPKDDTDKEEPAQKAEISRGKIDGAVYTNEYMGFTFTKPDSWVYATDDEIAAAINLGVEIMLGEDFDKVLENNQTVYDMMVSDLYSRTNINVGYENLAISLATNITVEQYIEVFKQQISNVPGMAYQFSEDLVKIKLGETEFTRLICSVEAFGATMTQAYYFTKIDKFMSSIIVTIPSGYTVQEIEAMFK